MDYLHCIFEQYITWWNWAVKFWDLEEQVIKFVYNCVLVYMVVWFCSLSAFSGMNRPIFLWIKKCLFMLSYTIFYWVYFNFFSIIQYADIVFGSLLLKCRATLDFLALNPVLIFRYEKTLVDFIVWLESCRFYDLIKFFFNQLNWWFFIY